MMTLDHDTDPVSDLDLEPDPDFNSASDSIFADINSESSKCPASKSKSELLSYKVLTLMLTGKRLKL
jgi:hypothetical protein